MSLPRSFVFTLVVSLLATVPTRGDEPVRRPVPKDGPLGMKFVPLPKGTFYMGGGGGKAGKQAEIKEAFEIAVHTVTQGQWQELMGNNPSWFSRDGAGSRKVTDIKDEDLKRFPVDNVSWDAAQDFIKKLNESEKGKGFRYRLPSAAEWEYACRGGATTQEECSYHFYFEKPANDASAKQANFDGMKRFEKKANEPNLERTTKVGSYEPNKLGLYDMHGNVWQWCAEIWGGEKPLNPEAPIRVRRGGSWDANYLNCQAANLMPGAQKESYSNNGFRLVRVAVKQQPAKPPAPKDGPLGMKFVPLPKGTTYLGWGGGLFGKNKGVKTEIKEDFEIATHTVTQGQWQTLMGNNPSHFSRTGGGKDKVKDIKDEDLQHFPVETVSLHDALEFIQKLNEQGRGQGYLYRLPKHWEWEYACRGGATTEAECSFHFYVEKPTNELSSVQANFNGNKPYGQADKGPYLGRTTKVGSYAPNKLGLYDMHGNIWQRTYYMGDDGIRGGGWSIGGASCTAANRVWYNPYDNYQIVGFRLVRTAVKEQPVKEPPTKKEQPAKPPAPKDGPLGMKFVPLPKGTTYLGWNGQPGTAKKTEIKEDFEVAIYTVTQGQWTELMGINPSYFMRQGGGNDAVKEIKDEDLRQFPVETVSWEDAQAFIKKLNEKEKGKGYVYRLPMEAEWEYACRGGATTEEECSYHYYFEKPTNHLSSTQANFNGKEPYGKGKGGQYLYRTTKVGSYAPNQLGLYDMHGNVYQWCEDRIDPRHSDRVSRGGCWTSPGKYCQAAFRFGLALSERLSFRGFRLIRVAIKEQPAKPAPEVPMAKDGPLGMKFVPLPKGTFYMSGGGKAGKQTASSRISRSRRLPSLQVR